MSFADRNFAKIVEVRTPASNESEFAEEKQVQLSAERGLGAKRAFRYGGDAAEVRGKPVDDEAGFSQRTDTEDEAGCARVHNSNR